MQACSTDSAHSQDGVFYLCDPVMALRFATFLIGLHAGLDGLGRQAECASKGVAEGILRRTAVRWRSDSCTGQSLPPIDLETRVYDWANAVAQETSLSAW